MSTHASNEVQPARRHVPDDARLKVLKPAQIAAYRDNGFLSPLQAIGPQHAMAARAQLEAFEAQNGGTWPRDSVLKPHLLLPWLDEIVRHPTILDTIEDLLGPDILCWSSRVFLKSPRDGGYVSWHQDVAYWGLDISENILTAWVALSPATKHNGVMKVIPGSHKQIVAHKEGVANNLLLRGQEVAVTVDESKAVFMELEAGEMSVHHSLMFHGSEENRADERRLGFAIRYIPTRVAQIAGLPRDSALLVRGTDRYNHFDAESSPTRALAPEAVALHRKATATYAEINRLAVAKHDEIVGATRQ
jgi:non-heme Fe2+,alpha-ketoglutarate-dependent halogenase